MVAVEGGDVDVVVAVVVVVADGAAHAVHLDVEAGLTRYVGKSSVVVVVVERGVGLARAVAGPVHGIDEENVLPAVVVVVDEADAAAHGFRQIFLAEGAAVVLEMNSGLRGDVGEVNRTGGPSAAADGWRLSKATARHGLAGCDVD